MGSDAQSRTDYAAVNQFQSTLPAWGVTGGACASGTGSLISIHTPRMGSDN